MSLDADTIVDRRRMRRKLTFWRVLAVLIAICAVVAVGAALRAPGTSVLTGATGGSIARITITGLIRGDQDRVEALERLGKSRAQAVIVHINSPGGTTSGSEQLHDALGAAEGAEAAGRRGRRAGGVRRLHHRHGRRSHRGAGDLAGRLDRRAVSVSERHRPPEDARHQDRGDQIVAAQGGAQRLRADLGRRRARRSRRSSRIPMPGSAAW